jgi:hypothetical protein
MGDEVRKLKRARGLGERVHAEGREEEGPKGVPTRSQRAPGKVLKRAGVVPKADGKGPLRAGAEVVVGCVKGRGLLARGGERRDAGRGRSCGCDFCHCSISSRALREKVDSCATGVEGGGESVGKISDLTSGISKIWLESAAPGGVFWRNGGFRTEGRLMGGLRWWLALRCGAGGIG